MTTQTKHDEERGISADTCLYFALMLMFGGPAWKIIKARTVIKLTLRKMGFKIVPMERADYGK